jgi:hypothetical protein
MMRDGRWMDKGNMSVTDNRECGSLTSWCTPLCNDGMIPLDSFDRSRDLTSRALARGRVTR